MVIDKDRMIQTLETHNGVLCKIATFQAIVIAALLGIALGLVVKAVMG